MQNYQKNSRKIGDIGESGARRVPCEDTGMRYLRSNYTVRGGEIDIIASKEM